MTPIVASAALRSAGVTRDPRLDATGFARLQGDLRPDVITPWWYDVTIYAIVGNTRPRLLLRAEGCETYVLRADSHGSFRARGATVTSFKEPVTGDWLDSFENPLTRKHNIVRPNVITGVTTLYPADGSGPQLDGSAMKPSQIAAGGSDGSKPGGWLRWVESGDRIGCVAERHSTGPIQPFMETASMWSDHASFFDTACPRAEATFTSSFLSPWLAWLEMGEHPGHLLWHSTGRKLRSLSELPPDFASRAELLAPGKLHADPFSS